MKIIEITILLIASCITIGWIYGIRKYVASGSGITRQTVNTTMLFVCSVVLVLIFKWSSLNLLWMFPLGWVLGTFSLALPFSLLWIPGRFFAQICTIGISNNKTGLQKEINRLTREIELDNNKNSALFKKYGNDAKAVNNLPEFTDPKIVIPQICKRQHLAYLLSKKQGKTDIESFHDILMSRFDTNPTNPFKTQASDFSKIINTKGFTISDLCKEIVRRENPDQNPAQLNYLDTLVDGYFQTETT